MPVLDTLNLFQDAFASYDNSEHFFDWKHRNKIDKQMAFLRYESWYAFQRSVYPSESLNNMDKQTPLDQVWLDDSEMRHHPFRFVLANKDLRKNEFNGSGGLLSKTKIS